ncbi:MAG TPA: sulfatase-like hydrolase/transferase [Acidimicrobiales bacterium]|jgi:arylsulfatase|nr:sulfatase-like hydrolase/transferase [Acidimicrobiales bacterium]
MSEGRNVLLVVSDQERNRRWLPPAVRLPWRDSLIRDGLELTNYWTHSSPCSPSRATMMTGRYLPGHGVVDNVIFPWHTELSTGIPTVGRLLSEGAGYRSSYIGKWHLSYGPHPDMAAYGYADWSGDDRHFMGWAGTGVHFDPIIASDAALWLAENGRAGPWFLTVALVNPHDVMWFPIDQPSYQQAHAEEVAFCKQFLQAAKWKESDPIPPYTAAYPAIFDELPDNFTDDLSTKPAAHAAWLDSQQNGVWGRIDPVDKQAWLRQLDYYAELHRLADESLGIVLAALEDCGAAGDTAVIFTSDHGDMCGSHGLRSKGPFVYSEIMNVPCYLKVPGVTTAGSTSDCLASHVDLAPTICSLAGLSGSRLESLLGTFAGGTGMAEPRLPGVDLTPLCGAPDEAVRDHVLFAMDSAHTAAVRDTRYALRGYFDGRHKYARYYGLGGGLPNDDFSEPGRRSAKRVAVDAAFEDQEHELYDLWEDPGEVVNLAIQGAGAGLVERFQQLLEYEAVELF